MRLVDFVKWQTLSILLRYINLGSSVNPTHVVWKTIVTDTLTSQTNQCIQTGLSFQDTDSLTPKPSSTYRDIWETGSRQKDHAHLHLSDRRRCPCSIGGVALLTASNNNSTVSVSGSSSITGRPSRWPRPRA